MDFFHSSKKRYIDHQVEVVAPFFSGKEKLLDFGCGDLAIAEALHKQFPTLSITGIDVVDAHVRIPGIRFTLYDGKRLPFTSGAFDSVVSYHVLHHCDDPRKSFAECVRVSRKQIILIEPIMRSKFDRTGVRFADWLCNIWRPEEIPLPYNFLSKDEWSKVFRTHQLRCIEQKEVGVLPRFLPIGETWCFVLEKQK